MKDLRHLTYFLDLEVRRRSQGIFLNQDKYIQDLVALARLTDTTSVDRPMKINVKYRSDEGDLLEDFTLYQKLVGILIYLYGDLKFPMLFILSTSSCNPLDNYI